MSALRLWLFNHGARALWLLGYWAQRRRLRLAHWMATRDRAAERTKSTLDAARPCATCVGSGVARCLVCDGDGVVWPQTSRHPRHVYIAELAIALQRAHQATGGKLTHQQALAAITSSAAAHAMECTTREKFVELCAFAWDQHEANPPEHDA